MAAPRDAGFTLIEALTALALLAMAAGVFYRGIELGARGARVAERESAALALAQNRLAEAAALGPGSTDAESGETETGLAWTTSFTEHETPGSAITGEPLRLMRIDVRVAWRDIPGRPTRDVTLSTFIPNRRSDALQ